MHLAHLRLLDFRNYARLDMDFPAGFHLILGENAQGKTNILEAIYLIATLRSFRGVGSAQMVRHGQKGYFVGGKVTGQGEHEVKMYWSARERTLNLDGRPVRNHSKFISIDHRFLIVTSANFSWSAENVNLELGVLIDNRNLAEAVEHQMRDVEDDVFERVRPPR